MLSKEQISELKEKLIKQIDENFPADKKEFAIQQVEVMNSEELEEFLRKNNLIKEIENPQCIFCNITTSEIPSYKIDENKKAIAVLEINPISKGHSIIIPKEHISSAEQVPEEAFSLAKKVSERIKTVLKPKKIILSLNETFEHLIINLIPIYSNENIKSERKKATDEDLRKVQKELVIEKQDIKKPVIINEKIRLPRRIP
jgi:histidine triad (HIT) family protein